MTLVERLFQGARGAQFARHFLRKQFPKRGHLVAFGPRHLRAGPMMREIFQAQMEAGELVVVAQNVAKYFKSLRLTVRGQAHHFVFVTELRKAEILRDCGVIQAERVWERDCASDLHPIADPQAPHSACKVAQTISGEQESVLEW